MKGVSRNDNKKRRTHRRTMESKIHCLHDEAAAIEYWVENKLYGVSTHCYFFPLVHILICSNEKLMNLKFYNFIESKVEIIAKNLIARTIELDKD